MTVRFLVQEVAQGWGIDQVAIVGKADAIGGINVEGLTLSALYGELD